MGWSRQRRRPSRTGTSSGRSTGVDEIANHVVWATALPLRHRPPAVADLPGMGARGRRGRRSSGCARPAEVPIDEPLLRDGGGDPGRESVLNRLALKPVDRDDLLHIVESLLREKYEGEPDRRRRRRLRAAPPRPAGLGPGPRATSPPSRSWPAWPTTCTRAARPRSRSACSTATTCGSGGRCASAPCGRPSCCPACPFVPEPPRRDARPLPRGDDARPATTWPTAPARRWPE